MGYKVCIVDDDDIYQFTTQRSLLKNSNVDEILPFTQAEDAIEFLKTHKYDEEKLPHILLLDINMPYMDGWDFLKEFQLILPELCHTIDVYLISSSIRSVDIERSKTFAEVKGYLVKPVGADVWSQIFNEKSKTIL